MRHSIFVGVVVAALFFVGCGDSDSGGGGGGGLLTSSSPAGVWVIDQEASKPNIEKFIMDQAGPAMEQAKAALAQLPKEQADEMRKKMDEQIETQMNMMWTSFEKLKVHLKDDGTYSVEMPDDDKPKTGKWKLSGDTLEITPDKVDGEDDDGKVPTIKYMGDQLELSDKEMPFKLYMKRS